jgi:hypothetical protein
LEDGSPAAIAGALKQVAPALGDYPIAVRESAGEEPDHRTPQAWVDDLAQRFTALHIEPSPT